jgi:ParG protein
MSRKSVPFGATPQPPAPAPDPETWVKRRGEGQKKRLTFAIPQELHQRMKVACARRGTSMVGELEALLEKHYPPEER